MKGRIKNLNSAIIAILVVTVSLVSEAPGGQKSAIFDGSLVNDSGDTALLPQGHEASTRKLSVASAPPPCESTGFEPIGMDSPPALDPACGWNLGWICDEAVFLMDSCTDEAVGECTAGNVASHGKCCAELPNPHNEWFQSASSVHCAQPHISNANPHTGAQHLRIAHDPTRPTNAGISVLTPASGGPYPEPAPWRIEFDLAVGVPSPPPLPPVTISKLIWLQLGGDPPTSNGRLHWIGSDSARSDLLGAIITYDYGLHSYQHVAYASWGGAYDHITIEGDPCAGTITYTVETSPDFYPPGTYTYVASLPTTQSQNYVRAMWQTGGNLFFHYDLDNFVVFREKEPCAENQGACCDGETGECRQSTMAGCNCEACEWNKGTSCSAIECDSNVPLFQPIPAVSEWGLLILALLLLVAGKIFVGTRNEPKANS